MWIEYRVMQYEDFLKKKAFSLKQSGFEIAETDLHNSLFPFQKVIVKWALKKGRAALFLDTGLGKTRCQVSFADQVQKKENGRCLILAPLCVGAQTIEEAAKIGVTIYVAESQKDCVSHGIYITNYEKLHLFDLAQFNCLILDESSILKSHDSKTREYIIESSKSIPYRLACTATPSPNDFMELGNHSEFLGVMKRTEMLSMFFTHDGSETQKWRLKGHAKTRFWEWMSTWAVCIAKPSDLGFDDTGYILPKLNVIEHIVKSNVILEGELLPRAAESLGERIKAKAQTIDVRCAMAKKIIKENSVEPGSGQWTPWLVWCHRNQESDTLEDLIGGSLSVSGRDAPHVKEHRLTMFSQETLQILITKPSIAGFGLNWQHCNNMVFVGLNDSFEEFYQAVRRCYRFGQTKEVNVHIITADIEGQILQNIKRKESQAREMRDSMIEHMRDLMKREILGTTQEKSLYMTDLVKTDTYELHLSDCVELAKKIPDGTVDYTVFSPPFSSLYVYSNSDRDMGNNSNDNEFIQHFSFLVEQLFRVTRPGRLVSFHCMNLPTSKQNHGYIGIRDFRGELIKLFQSYGFIYHSEVCIWKHPVIAMQRTKALGLLHKQIRKDSAMCRQGIPDYLVTMRKPGENSNPIDHTHEDFPVSLWQKIASPIWMDINPSNTLQFRMARENDDERHICPLQLEVIERAMMLWSKKNDLVFSPFTGIGSEGYVALKMGRKFIGCELKKSYYEIAKKNLDQATVENLDLFATAGLSAPLSHMQSDGVLEAQDIEG